MKKESMMGNICRFENQKINGDKTEFPTRKFDPPTNRRVKFMPVAGKDA
jgi:hypothetical protein